MRLISETSRGQRHQACHKSLEYLRACACADCRFWLLQWPLKAWKIARTMSSLPTKMDKVMKRIGYTQVGVGWNSNFLIFVWQSFNLPTSCVDWQGDLSVGSEHVFFVANDGPRGLDVLTQKETWWWNRGWSFIMKFHASCSSWLN